MDYEAAFNRLRDEVLSIPHWNYATGHEYTGPRSPRGIAFMRNSQRPQDDRFLLALADYVTTEQAGTDEPNMSYVMFTELTPTLDLAENDADRGSLVISRTNPGNLERLVAWWSQPGRFTVSFELLYAEPAGPLPPPHSGERLLPSPLDAILRNLSKTQDAAEFERLTLLLWDLDDDLIQEYVEEIGNEMTVPWFNGPNQTVRARLMIAHDLCRRGYSNYQPYLSWLLSTASQPGLGREGLALVLPAAAMEAAMAVPVAEEHAEHIRAIVENEIASGSPIDRTVKPAIFVIGAHGWASLRPLLLSLMPRYPAAVKAAIDNFGTATAKEIERVAAAASVPVAAAPTPSSKKTNAGSPSGGTSSKCFIATAAFGSPLAEEVQILRRFRDRRLLTNRTGRMMNRLYIKISPPIAAMIERRGALQRAVRVPVALVARLLQSFGRP